MSEESLALQEYIKKPIPIHAIQIFEDFEVETLEGIMKGHKFDYLITGIKGEKYPCDRDIFESSYVRVK